MSENKLLILSDALPATKRENGRGERDATAVGINSMRAAWIGARVCKCLKTRSRLWGMYLPPVFCAKSAEEYDGKGVVENARAKECAGD